MDDSHLLPSEQDLQWALEVETSVTDENRAVYLDCMNGRPMSVRVEPRDLRSGCILTGVFARIQRGT